MRNQLVAVLFFCQAIGLLPAAAPPSAEISNGQITAKVYLPDAAEGFYRGTRFDWSGVIHSLQYQGHDYYGPWFTKTDPNVRDFIYQDADIIAGPCSAITGPVDEFGQIGWEEAKAGGTFIKIGVGVLRKPADGRYDAFHLYEIVDGGKRTVRKTRDTLVFTQQVKDPSSGYSYAYQKTVRLIPGKPQMVLEHRLKNTGRRAISTNTYNHNFLVLDGRPTGSGFVITLPFPVQTGRPLNRELAETRGNQIVYTKTLTGRDVVFTPVQGFGNTARDATLRIENSNLGAGMSISGDRPLLRQTLWSIRSVISMEPFVSLEIPPGKEFTWKSTYNYYTLDKE